jgi:ABC-type glycerol-3-phosphate transport system substrate-binding protein
MRAAPVHSPRGRRDLWLATGVALFSLAGCPAADPPKQSPAPQAPVALEVLVVDDPPLAEAIGRLQGEWQAQGGGPLEVQQTTAAELRGRQELDADVVVFPEVELGALADRNWLTALDRDIESDEAYQWYDVFPRLRQSSVRWGPETLALPLGSRVLLLAAQGNIDPGLRSPKTWAELLAALESGEPKPRIALPLAEGWAGRTFLAWAAPYVRHPDYFSGVFNKDTLEPQIASPPFVRALEELTKAAAQGHVQQFEFGPVEAWQAVARGEAEWAIGWPAASETAAEVSVKGQDDAPAIVASALPGSAEAHNPLRNTWDRLESGLQSAPLVGLEGRLAAASASTVDGLAAFRLLALLTGPQWSGEIAPVSAATAPFRGRQISPPAWRLPPPADATNYASAVAESLTAPRSLSVLRIPGHEEYLAALDRAVRQAVRGDAAPQSALDQTAEEWRRITAKRGLEAQRAAYQRSLGLAER